MKWLGNIFREFLVSIGLLKVPLFKFKHIDDWPDEPKPFILYLQGKSSQEWLAGLLCPCGCEDMIEIVLLKDQHPRWEITKHSSQNISIHPSIKKTVGCKSHFYLKNSKIIWCN